MSISYVTAGGRFAPKLTVTSKILTSKRKL